MNPLAALPRSVTLCEVGPRDGLQNETQVVAAGRQGALRRNARRRRRPRNRGDVVRSPRGRPATGRRRRRVSGDSAARRACATSRWCRTSAGSIVRSRPACGISSSSPRPRIRSPSATSACRSKRRWRRLPTVIRRAHENGMRVRASVSTAFGCPFEGDVPPANVVRVAAQLLAAGADELSIADTIGVGTPDRVVAVTNALFDAGIDAGRFGLHFHDTRGTALANITGRPADGRAPIRFLGRRAGRLPVRARRDRQRRDRRRPLSACTGSASRPGSTSTACAPPPASSAACWPAASCRARTQRWRLPRRVSPSLERRTLSRHRRRAPRRARAGRQRGRVPDSAPGARGGDPLPALRQRAEGFAVRALRSHERDRRRSPCDVRGTDRRRRRGRRLRRQRNLDRPRFGTNARARDSAGRPHRHHGDRSLRQRRSVVVAAALRRRRRHDRGRRARRPRRSEPGRRTRARAAPRRTALGVQRHRHALRRRVAGAARE